MSNYKKKEPMGVYTIRQIIGALPNREKIRREDDQIIMFMSNLGFDYVVNVKDGTEDWSER